MVHKWWVACAALFTVLAGCLEGETPDAEPLDSDPAPTEPADGNQTAPPVNETENAAPVASLEASAQNGTAPLNVTFTLGGSDADGDNLTWTLTVGNDTVTGDVLPASVNRTLAAGNHTVTLTVSDGNLTGNASVLVVVAEAPVPEEGDGMCHRDTAAQPGGVLYLHGEGGTWIFQESNGVAGLQVGNTHPTGPDGGGQGFANPDWADCQNGDRMLV